MTTIENQYAYLFSQLGHTTEFYPEKSLFHLKESNIYCKVCENPASDETIKKAIEGSRKHQIVLLEGGISFKSFRMFNNGEESCPVVFLDKSHKWYPLYWGYDFDLEYFRETTIIVSLAIRCGEDVECHRCGLVNDFTVSKPSLHYKATCRCGNYITNISENKPSALYFGKYKGRLVSSMQGNDELQYLEWGLTQNMFKGKLKRDVIERLLKV